MVMGDDLFLRGRGFKSWHSILDGPVYYHIDLLLKLYCLFEKSEKTKIGQSLPICQMLLPTNSCFHFPENYNSGQQSWIGLKGCSDQLMK